MLGVIALLFSLSSWATFATPIDDAFSEYLREMEPAHKKLQEELQTDIVVAWQYSDLARRNIADKTVFLAKLTRDSYRQIVNLVPENEIDSERKNLILAELLERNTQWTSTQMPGKIPLTVSCISAPIRTTQYFVENQGDRYADLFSDDNKAVRALIKSSIGAVAFLLVSTPFTAACFIVGPFYDAAYYSGYDPIQNFHLDLKELTKPYIIEI
jgi:hypothetical protein